MLLRKKHIGSKAAHCQSDLRIDFHRFFYYQFFYLMRVSGNSGVRWVEAKEKASGNIIFIMVIKIRQK